MRYFFTEDPQTTPFSISNIPARPAPLLRQPISRVKLTTRVQSYVHLTSPSPVLDDEFLRYGLTQPTIA